jgi:hypothetical protein
MEEEVLETEQRTLDAFLEREDKRFWRNVVTDPAAFEASLLANLGVTASDFVDLGKKMRRYRDKFVAHLDSTSCTTLPISSDCSSQAVENPACCGDFARTRVGWRSPSMWSAWI